MPAQPAQDVGNAETAVHPPQRVDSHDDVGPPAVERLLGHPVRRAIADHIGAHPGVDLAEVTRAVHAGWGNVHHHVERLRRAGLIAIVREGHHARLFLCDAVAPQDRMRTALLANPAVRVVYDAIGRHRGIIQRDLAADLGVTATAIRKVVRRLVANGLVQAERTGKQVRYAVSWPAGASALPDIAKNPTHLPTPGPPAQASS